MNLSPLRNNIIFPAIAACLLFTKPAPAEQLTLVKDGQPTSVIVVPVSPNRPAQWSAKEIQLHIKKITGATVPIVHEQQKIAPGLIKIAVGESALTQEMGIKMADLGKQEYVVKGGKDVVALVGRDDETDIWPAEVSGKYETAEGVFGSGIKLGSSMVGVRKHGFSDEAGTVEVWLNPTSNHSIWRAGGGHELYTSVNKGIIEYRTTSGEPASTITISAPMIKDGWHLVSATWDAAANKAELLIDGKVVASGAYQKTNCATAEFFAVGGYYGKGGYAFASGVVDELRLSNVVRKYGESVEKKPFEADEQTKLLLHFDDKAAPKLGSFVMSDEMPSPVSPCATCYAAYDFLEQACGVRWYFPTDLGTVIPKSTTLAVTVPEIKRRPVMLSRGGSSIDGQGGEEWGMRMNNILFNRASYEDGKLWAMRMRLGGWAISFNHSFYGYYDRFWKGKDKRVEFFAKGYEDRAEPPQLCYTNPKLIEHVIGEARAAFDGGAESYGVVPMDNADQCKCEECRKLIDLEKDQKFSQGSASRLIWSFTDKIAREVAKTHPGRYIGQLAYFDYTKFPTGLKLSPNIISGPCVGFNMNETLDSETNPEMKMYKEWVAEKKETGRILSCWIYQCFPNETGGQRGYSNLPGFHAHTLVKYMRIMATDKIEGVYLCGISAHIDGYLTLKLMDDPNLDLEKTMAEFFSLYYGPAGVPLRKFYDSVEASFAMQKTSGIVQVSYDRAGMKGLMKNCGEWIKEAKKLAQTEEEKKRVALFEDAVWNHMKKGFQQYADKCGGNDPYPISPITVPTEREEGKFGNALKMNGVFGIWEHGFNDEQGTMEAWIKVGMGRTLFQIEGRDPRSSQKVYRAPSYIDPKTSQKRSDIFVYATKAGDQVSEISTKPMGDGWHHLMATWSAKEKKKRLYVDGKLNAEGPYTKTACSTAYRFGIGGQAEEFDFKGLYSDSWGNIDEVRVSNVIRPPTLPGEPFKTDANTLILFNFDEPAGKTPVELSGRDWSQLAKPRPKENLTFNIPAYVPGAGATPTIQKATDTEAPASPAAAAPPAKTTTTPGKEYVTLKKPVTAQLRFGSVTIGTGTRLKVISTDGKSYQADFNGSAVIVPADATE